jgi:hypothetical protein
LSIVRAIATSHNAAVRARPLADGGLSVTVTFPPIVSSTTSPKNGSRTRRHAASYQ